MVSTTVLGFPRMGSDRQLKKLLEAYWKGKVTLTELTSGAQTIRASNWSTMESLGLDSVTVGDFSLYDHLLDTAIMFNVIPTRFQEHFKNELNYIYHEISLNVYKSEKWQEIYFALARGIENRSDTNNEKQCKSVKSEGGLPSLEMKKWFNTNYHSLVPEISAETDYKLVNLSLVEEFEASKKLGHSARAVIIGPITFLHYCKLDKGDSQLSDNKFSHADKLLKVYTELILRLEAAGCEWVQFDEPILSTSLSRNIATSFSSFYQNLPVELDRQRKKFNFADNRTVKLLLANYFGAYKENLGLALALPFDGFHFDFVYGKSDLTENIFKSFNTDKVISLGVVDGRNIWKNNTAESQLIIKTALASLRSENVWISSSCSLLFVPHSLGSEKGSMKKEILEKLAFATEKIQELVNLKPKGVSKGSHPEADGIVDKVETIVDIYSPDGSAIEGSILSVDNHPALNRNTKYKARKELQDKIFQLPLLPTTTIGSFPQTLEVRKYRQSFRKGKIYRAEYDEFIRTKTSKCIQWQLDIGLDVLVHGEYERNDMVEFFGENMSGFTTTKNGWVQSYGSRCVKPPVIYGDVARINSMTVELTKYAQQQAKLLSNGSIIRVKGMLTGPVTIIQWSFVRNDIHVSKVAEQIGYAIREEVLDLEANGIDIIQVDEPAIREGLPLRVEDQKIYKKWAVNSFKLSTSGVRDTTMIHTHMCYSDFNEIASMIKRMDVDVLTVENSKSDLKLVSKNSDFVKTYEAGIGPGVYDVHSPIIPSKLEIESRVHALLQVFDKNVLWINPDCGNKTRTEEEVDLTLRNMIAVAKEIRTHL